MAKYFRALVPVAVLALAVPAAAQEAEDAPAKGGAPDGSVSGRQPSAGQADEAAANARRFFQAAQQAFADGKFAEAARSFEEAFRIKPHPAPLINAGDAWEKAGEYALAARSFQKALSLPQASERDRADAVDRLSRLKPQLGELKLLGDPAIRVRVDDEEFQGGETVFVFPGEHRVTLADVDGAKVRTLTLLAAGTRSIDVATLKPDPRQTATDGGATDVAADEAAPSEAQRGFPFSIPTMVGYGVAVLGAGAAVYFGLQVNDAESSFSEAPNRDDYDRFNTNKLLTNISLGVSVVGAGVGTYFLLQDLSKKKQAEAEAEANQRHVDVDVLATPGGAAVRAFGRF
jgi:tetratricopeptide (TPR) repeat protein